MRVFFSALLFLAATSCAAEDFWKLHTIDDTSRGADGARLADVNADGHLDIATGWEEGGVIRAYLNPGPKLAGKPWPKVTVGKVKSPEDAVFADLDGDGAIDVVSSCEGRTKTMFFHWAPKARQSYLDEAAWKTEAVPATKNAQSWMFALPMDVDGRNGIDLIVSSKGGGASIGWLESPKNPRDVAAWKYHRLRDAGWIMSLEKFDMDGDGDLDIIASDRKGASRGVFWLGNPGAAANRKGEAWKDYAIGAKGREVMFLDLGTRKGNLEEILVATKPNDFWRISRGEGFTPWVETVHSLPANRVGTAKSVRRGDVDLDGIPDFVFSCEQASGAKTGLVWLKGRTSGDPMWTLKQLAGPKGVKYDLLQLADLDADGDLDVICCEERANLGVFWYENPTK